MKWSRAKEAFRWVTGKPAQAPPVDFLFAYYPSSNQLRLRADISGLPKAAKLTRLTATVRDRLEGKAIRVVEFPLAGFKAGRQELSCALPPLNGFVSEWLTFQAILISPQLPSWGLKLIIPAVGGLLALAAALAADLDTPGVLVVGDELAEGGDGAGVAATASVLGVELAHRG